MHITYVGHATLLIEIGGAKIAGESGEAIRVFLANGEIAPIVTVTLDNGGKYGIAPGGVIGTEGG